MPDPVLILTGPPGAGKTTTACLIAEGWERAAQIEGDSFFRFIRSGYIEPWLPRSHDQNTKVMDIVAGAASGYADAGYFTIIDGIVSPQWFLEPLRDSLRAAGHSTAYCVLRAPLALCSSRAASRSVDRIVDAAVVEQLWQQFADLGPLESHAIDSGDRGAEEVATEVERKLRAGLLNL